MTPYRCPVCYGKGQVLAGFYNLLQSGQTTSVDLPEPCRSCGCTGILWSPENIQPGVLKVTYTADDSIKPLISRYKYEFEH